MRIILGRELPVHGERRLRGVTLGAVLEELVEREPKLAGLAVTAYVNGRLADHLEGPDTPVGDEDTVLLTPGYR